MRAVSVRNFWQALPELDFALATGEKNLRLAQVQLHQVGA